MKQFFEENKWVKNMVTLALLFICIYLSLIHFKALELTLEFQYFWVKVDGVSYRVDTMAIRLVVLLIFALVWGIVWAIMKKAFHKKALCPLLIATCLLCGFGTYLINLYGDTFVWLHTKVEYAFSLYEGDYEGDINVEIKDDTVWIFHSENEELSYFDYKEWKEYQWDDLELSITFYKDTSATAIVNCIADYDAEQDAYYAQIPDLLDNYQCGLLTVRAGGENGSIYTGICLGSLKRAWYQQFLNTDLLMEDLVEENGFDEAIEDGKIGAGIIPRMIWRIFVIITCDSGVHFFLLILGIYAVDWFVIALLTFVDWAEEKIRQEELREKDVWERKIALKVMQDSLMSWGGESEASDSDLDTHIDGRKNTEEKKDPVRECEP